MNSALKNIVKFKNKMKKAKTLSKIRKLLLLTSAVLFLTIPETKAWFSDTEISEKNIWSAGNLTIRLEDKEENFDPATDLSRGDTTQRDITVINDGTTGFLYNLEFYTDQTNDLCEQALLTVTTNSTTVYDEKLADFTLEGSTETFFLNKEEEQVFSFEIKIPTSADTYVGEMLCEFDIVGEARMDGYEYGTAWWDFDVISSFFSTTSWSIFDPGDVVINEIMWSGSRSIQQDYWIELLNTTDEDIDLTGWTMPAVGPSFHEITLEGEIPAGGFFLLAHYETDHTSGQNNFAAINDDIEADQVDNLLLLQFQVGEQLTLLSPDGDIIDQTPEVGQGANESWAAGEWNDARGPFKSMQRIDPNEDGTDPDNWATCEKACDPDNGTCDDNPDYCNSGYYWDEAGGVNFGTPKHPNIICNSIDSSGGEGDNLSSSNMFTLSSNPPEVEDTDKLSVESTENESENENDTDLAKEQNEDDKDQDQLSADSSDEGDEEDLALSKETEEKENKEEKSEQGLLQENEKDNEEPPDEEPEPLEQTTSEKEESDNLGEKHEGETNE